MGDKGAKELWGLDISTSQVNQARAFLKENHYSATIFESPMEINPGIPLNYFDIVYSIYAFGWTKALEKSIELVSNYLKPGGYFVMSWDHPILNCIEVKDEALQISRSYHLENDFKVVKESEEMHLIKWKLSSYFNAFYKAGMVVEKFIEDVPEEILAGEFNDLNRYYSKEKAQLIPLSMIIKARKL